MMSESTTEQDRIERDLARTRSRMDNRLAELQARLSPGQVLDDLMDYFRGSEGADFTRNLMDSVKNNPLPAALTGIGLTWLMASNPHPRHDADGDDKVALSAPPGNRAVLVTSSQAVAVAVRNRTEFERHFRDAEHNVVRQNDEAEDAYRGRLDAAKGAVLGVARQAQDTAETFSKRVQDAFEAATQSVTDGAHNLGDWASDTARQLTGATEDAGKQPLGGSQSAQQMGRNLLAAITDNPMLLGAIGLAAGALLGAVVPRSDKEDAALGGMAGKAREAVGDLAQEAVDRGGKVARQVLDAGRDSTRMHGLTGDKTVGSLVDEALSGDLVGSVGRVAKDVLRAGEDSFRKEGLGEIPEEVNAASSSPPNGATPPALADGAKA